MSDRTAKYKGRTYRLLFMGKTKHGQRAKLAFMDGSKEFWVEASAVIETKGGGSTPTASRSGGRRTGCACGSIEGEYYDWYCASCRFDELDM